VGVSWRDPALRGVRVFVSPSPHAYLHQVRERLLEGQIRNPIIEIVEEAGKCERN